MRESIRTFSLIFGGALLFSGCSTPPFSQALRDFSHLLDTAAVQGQISLNPLRQLDPLLLRPASLYPQFSEIPLPALSLLYQYSQHCSGSLAGIPLAFQQFEQAQCQQTELPEQWFVAHPISPLGGSTAWHYLQRHPAEAKRMQAYLHVRERPQALGGVGQLSDDNLDALANGQSWLMQDGVLWRQQPQRWVRYAPEVWQPLAKQVGISLVEAGGRCDVALGTLCAIPVTRYPGSWRVLLAVALILALVTLAWAGWQRRQLQQRQRFIVQMLTHELRTPISQLGNVVEHFRRDFDTLSPDAQAGFGELADSVQRMRQMAEASRHYLAGEGLRDVLEAPVKITLSDWLWHIAEAHPGLIFCLEGDAEVALPLYWSSLCLNNLLDNAFRHGRTPVRLKARCRRGRLILEVSDAGELDAKCLTPLSRGLSSRAGMGLGLSIVQRVAHRLCGKLILSGPPTTFTLELPYEE
jgi:signal transduction histidine kinase